MQASATELRIQPDKAKVLPLFFFFSWPSPELSVARASARLPSSAHPYDPLGRTRLSPGLAGPL